MHVWVVDGCLVRSPCMQAQLRVMHDAWRLAIEMCHPSLLSTMFGLGVVLPGPTIST